MNTLYLDLETYCETPISAGTYRYAQAAEIMLVAYAVDDAPAAVWDLTAGEPMPAVFRDAWGLPRYDLVAHNALFDRTVLRSSASARPWGGQPPLTRWRCTMAKALAHSLPGSLDTLGGILGLPQDQRKHADGRGLVQLFCKPRPKNMKLRRATRETHPDEWARFIDYARLDVEAMRAIDRRLPVWNYSGVELALWRLDQQINDRGFAVDRPLAEGAIRSVDREQDRLAARTHALTDGAVAAATQRDALLAHVLAEYGVELPDMQAATIERRMEDPDLPEPLRELLAVRLASTTVSVRKYNKLLQAVSDDGRLRGTTQFCGAARTGRWSGRTFQPQNLPRPTMSQAAIDLGIEALSADCADLVLADVMSTASNALRGVIVAPSGRKIVASDLSNIEGRAQAWLAGEQWKLRAFAEFDAGAGPDLYKLAYAKSFGVRPDDVTKDQRQKGKVQELALGYEGGVGAFVTFAAGYGIDLDTMAREAWDTLPPALKAEAAEFWAWCVAEKRPTFGLSREVFIVCDTFKRAWRQAQPAIASGWKELEAVVRDAVAAPGDTLGWRKKLKVRRDGAWLRIGLPSGRALCYPQPHVDDAGKVSYMGINQYSRKWQRLKTYGGKLFENVCQAVARDVMAANMPAIEDTGYQIVLTVHDEVITEVDDDPRFNPAALSGLLAAAPHWASGLPLAAGGFEGPRYRKE